FCRLCESGRDQTFNRSPLFIVDISALPVSPATRLRQNERQPSRGAMANLYFCYSTMNAGKSTVLLQASYNYRERGMHTLLFTSALYAEYDEGEIRSRLGVSAPAELYSEGDDLFAWVGRAHREKPLNCVFVDE